VLHKGTPTDRLVAQWWIRKPHVERRVGSGAALTVRAADLADAAPINVTRPAGTWLANADLFLARDERRLVLEIPMGFTEMQREAPELALEWRMQTRELFETYFARGYRVVDFFLDRGQGCGRYLLATTES
jgi:chorismate synthase